MPILNTLTVLPSYQLTPTEQWTVAKLNLMAKPSVQLSLNQPILDENYLRNGNFYGYFWGTPGGVTCAAGSATTNASYWYCQPNGSGNVTYAESTTTPDLLSLYSTKLTGATGITDVLFYQQIISDLSATLRQVVTFSGWIYNGTGASFIPTLQVATANAKDNFATSTVQADLNLQSCPAGQWTYVTVTQDLSVYTNDNYGFQFAVHVPAGVLNSGSNSVNFSRLKIQPGSVATPYADDLSLFVNITSVGTTNLQNGCVTTAKIATGAVTYSELDPTTVDPFLCQTGSIVMWTTATAPTGWLLCQGQSLSTSTYATLFGVIGYAYGGSGSTFNIPNLQQRVPLGQGSGYTLATAGGAATHSISVSEMPAHNHGITDPTHNHSHSDPGHNHTLNSPGHYHTLPAHGHGVTDPGHTHADATYGLFGAASAYIYQSGSGTGASTATAVTGLTVNNAGPINVSSVATGDYNSAATTGVTNVAAGTGITVNNNGSGTAMSLVQPYLVLNFIIKT